MLSAGITRGHPRARRACGYRDARPARDPRPPETISASRPETSSCVHALSVVRDRPDCHPACDVQRIGGHQASLFAGEPAVIGFTRFAQCRLFVTQLPRFRAMRSDRGCRDFVPLLLSWHSLVMALFRLPPSPTRTEANDRKRNDRGKVDHIFSDCDNPRKRTGPSADHSAAGARPIRNVRVRKAADELGQQQSQLVERGNIHE
jgi:hypothetical protein